MSSDPSYVPPARVRWRCMHAHADAGTWRPVAVPQCDGRPSVADRCFSLPSVCWLIAAPTEEFEQRRRVHVARKDIQAEIKLVECIGGSRTASPAAPRARAAPVALARASSPAATAAAAGGRLWSPIAQAQFICILEEVLQGQGRKSGQFDEIRAAAPASARFGPSRGGGGALALAVSFVGLVLCGRRAVQAGAVRIGRAGIRPRSARTAAPRARRNGAQRPLALALSRRRQWRRQRAKSLAPAPFAFICRRRRGCQCQQQRRSELQPRARPFRQRCQRQRPRVGTGLQLLLHVHLLLLGAFVPGRRFSPVVSEGIRGRGAGLASLGLCSATGEQRHSHGGCHAAPCGCGFGCGCGRFCRGRPGPTRRPGPGPSPGCFAPCRWCRCRRLQLAPLRLEQQRGSSSSSHSPQIAPHARLQFPPPPAGGKPGPRLPPAARLARLPGFGQVRNMEAPAGVFTRGLVAKTARAEEKAPGV